MAIRKKPRRRRAGSARRAAPKRRLSMSKKNVAARRARRAAKHGVRRTRRVVRKTAKRRAVRRRRANPFDTYGFWHKKSSGRFGRPPMAGGRAATKRRRQTRKVAAHRRRSHGRFLNPVEIFPNPFTDRAGRVHRNDGKFAKRKTKHRKSTHSRRRRDAFGRFRNPSGHRGLPSRRY